MRGHTYCMTLEQRIKRRNAGRRTVKTGTAAIAVGATTATGILTAALAHPASEPDPAPASVTIAPIVDTTTVRAKAKKPKPPKATPVAATPTPAPKPKPAKTSGS